MKIEPLYPYMGGKRKLIKKYENFEKIPTDVSTYVEPFFGGGAMFCHMFNSGFNGKAIINDKRKVVMDINEAIKNDVDSEIFEKVIELSIQMDSSAEREREREREERSSSII